jgi:hypothetical protein
MRQLRNYGIYTLPDFVRQVYVVSSVNSTYLLYDRELGTSIPPRFEALPDGHIRDWHGDFTPWTTEDLRDTGENL